MALASYIFPLTSYLTVQRPNLTRQLQAVNPLGAYGRSKWEGEQHVRTTLPDSSVVLRTAWLYSEYGGNFVSTMLRLMNEREELSVVNDQVGSPTWARSVANAIFALHSETGLVGHLPLDRCRAGQLVRLRLRHTGRGTKLGLISKAIDIRSVSSGDYAAAATRPAYSVLDCSATASDLGLKQTPWRQSLRAMLEVSAGK